MYIKLSYQKSDSTGVFIRLTNSFCIIPYDVSSNFYRIIKRELDGKIPVISTFINESKCIGSFLVGNKNGLIVPYNIRNKEFENLIKCLPEEIYIKRCESFFSTLGNSIATNDRVAIVNPNISAEIIETISDVLGVEVFKLHIGSESLVGSYCVFNSTGGVVYSDISPEEQDELSTILEIPLLLGTVNCGSKLIGAGLSANDFVSFCGINTTQSELFVIETALKIKRQ